MKSPRLRPLRHDETALLEAATLGNVNWCGPRFTIDDVRERPEFAHYTHLESGRGDFGIVAEQSDILGVAWAVLLPESDPGYGFLNPAVPELSLWVTPTARRRGVGRTLLRALIVQAAIFEFEQLSLSVEKDNPAKDLYHSEGFTDVPGREEDGVMVLRLVRR